MPASSSQLPASSFQRFACVVLAMLVLPVALPRADAQTFEAVGTRAAGMGGAFVAVADDASAVYWNPAGLAGGAYFSLVLDHNRSEASRESDPQIGSQSATFLAAAMPALGFTYYRLRLTTVEEAIFPENQLDAPRALDGAAALRVASLVTHHTGVTLVQSLTDRIAVGTTLKLVRGTAIGGLVPEQDREDLLDETGGLVGRGSTEFDADIGVMAVAGALRAGLTVRNVREPEFDLAEGGDPLQLHRQVRAGVAYTTAGGLLVSADLDLQSVPGTTGLVRDFAAGAETRILRRLAVRAGFRFNTRDDQPAGRAPVGAVGASYAAMGSVLVDGQITFGEEQSDRGWGVGVRVLF